MNIGENIERIRKEKGMTQGDLATLINRTESIIRKYEIGENIKRIRKEKGMTQGDLATLINRTESSIRKYENGSIEIPISVIFSIATALNTTIQHLMGFKQVRLADISTDDLLKEIFRRMKWTQKP